MSRLYLDRHNALEPAAGKRMAQILRRRIAGEPLEYVLGYTEFMGLRLSVGPDVLIPRHETEILVEAVLAEVKSRENRAAVLDLCSGSGAICVSLACMSQEIKITASDISLRALAVARANARKHAVEGRIRFAVCDLFAGFKGKFDVIVSNPPYVSREQIRWLAPEVRKEPFQALDGGTDGLDFYRRIAGGARHFLSPGGALIVEIGCGQADEVSRLFKDYGLARKTVVKDYSGIDRVLVAHADS